MGELQRFYRPLAITTILRQSTRPLINAGIAAALLPRPSLAAWPVVWGVMMLISGPVWSLQQLTTALATDQAAYRRVRKFTLALSLFFAALFALLVFTPVYGLVMGGVYSLSPALQELARPAMAVLVIYPLVMGLQSMLRGLFIREGKTKAVQTAMIVHVSALAGTLALGVKASLGTGVLVAALATLIGASVELVWFWWKDRTWNGDAHA
jgi:O-antigen/teichoic acid export membrane protein